GFSQFQNDCLARGTARFAPGRDHDSLDRRLCEPVSDCTKIIKWEHRCSDNEPGDQAHQRSNQSIAGPKYPKNLTRSQTACPPIVLGEQAESACSVYLTAPLWCRRTTQACRGLSDW